MTIFLVILVGIGAVLTISSIDNTSITDTLGSIFKGSLPTKPTTGTWDSGQPGGAMAPNGTATQQSFTPTGTTGNYDWLNAPVTQQYGGAATGVQNTGIDLGTAFHSEISNITPGTVVSTTYSPQIGGQVLVAFQYLGKTMYAAYVHLDQIAVSVGQSVGFGDTIGLSGGQLAGGSHPAQYPYSTGPHSLFGIFSAPAASFANSIDPTQYFNWVKTMINNRGSTTA